MCKRFLYLIALILGLLGVVGSLAAIFCIWTCETRVERTAKKILGTIDDSLTVAQRRLGQTKERVEGLKFTTEEITTTIASWTKSEAKERLASQLEVTEKAQRIEAGLQQADHWLELTESSIQFVQQVVEMAIEIGAPLQTNFAEGSLEELALLRKEVAEAIEPLKRIQEHAAGEGLDEERLRRIRELCLRVVATITSVDARLVRLDDRLAKFMELRRRSRRSRACQKLVSSLSSRGHYL